MSNTALENIDSQHLWHPFTQHRQWFADDPLIIARGEGCKLYDIEGRAYLDGVSSLWCSVHGHGAPELLEALHAQADALCHSTLLGLSHVPVLELTRELIPVLPSGLTRVFYSDGGAVAVEAAMRMAIEWWDKQDTAAARKKKKLVSLESAYHGDTLGSVGLGYVEAFHKSLSGHIVPSIKLCPPHVHRFYSGSSEDDAVEKSLAAFQALLVEQSDEIAACVIEPLVQGAAGIWIHPPSFLQGVSRLCAQHDVLLIVDEVATGFGKTGKLFATEHAEISPDFLVLGKGLTAGYLPMSAVCTKEHIFEGFLGEPEELKTFFFGQTFSGNPLAARVAERSLSLISESNLLASVNENIPYFHSLLREHIEPLPHVDEVRAMGLMVGIEFTKRAGKREPYAIEDLVGARVTQAARERGLIIRPIGNVMILMPALAMSRDELSTLVSITAEAIRETL